MISVEQLRKDYYLDVLTEAETKVLVDVESQVIEAARQDKDHVVYPVTKESFSQFFILNTRVGNTLADAGYRVGIVKRDPNFENESEDDCYGALISFAGNR